MTSQVLNNAINHLEENLTYRWMMVMLHTLRKKIDCIDDQILQLIEQHAVLASEKRNFKPKNKIICYEREEALLVE